MYFSDLCALNQFYVRFNTSNIPHKITNIMSTLENINQYEITPTHLDRIADLVEKKRFKNKEK